MEKDISLGPELRQRRVESKRLTAQRTDDIVSYENNIRRITMAHGTESQLADDRVARLAQSLTQVASELNTQPPEELFELLAALARAQPEALPHHIPNPPAFHRMCRFIGQSGSPTMGELGNAISIPFSTATRWADWMIQNGFANRLSDRDDRRIVRISLTETGHRFLEIIEKHMAENARQMLSCLTVEEQTILLVIFEKVAKGLQQTED